MPSKRQTIIVIIKNVAEALVAVIIGTVLIVISSGQITDVVNSISSTERVSIEGQQQQIAISQLENQFKTIDGNEAKITNAFPHEENILPFINALNTLGSESGVQQSFSFGQPVSYSAAGNVQYYDLPYTISVSGNMNQFISYLKNFNAMPYYTDISAINVSAPNGLGEGVSMSLQADLYIQQ